MLMPNKKSKIKPIAMFLTSIVVTLSGCAGSIKSPTSYLGVDSVKTDAMRLPFESNNARLAKDIKTFWKAITIVEARECLEDVDRQREALKAKAKEATVKARKNKKTAEKIALREDQCKKALQFANEIDPPSPIYFPASPLDTLVVEAQSGDKYAQLELGIRLEEGSGGVDKNLKKARKFYRKAAVNSGGSIQTYLPAVNGVPGRPYTVYKGPFRQGLAEARQRLFKLEQEMEQGKLAQNSGDENAKSQEFLIKLEQKIGVAPPSSIANSGDENAESQEFPKAQTTANYDMPVGSELTLCDGCPTFVKVPSAPDNLRNIQYVSKYELTWKNYLAAVDEGACGFTGQIYSKAKPIKQQDIDRPSNDPPPLPVAARSTKKRLPLVTREERIRRNIDKFRVDWPITDLHPLDMKCFVDWFQNKTKLQVEVPSEKEWEWFASAGDPNNKYPWGNKVDTSHEALDATKVPYELIRPATMTGRFDSKISDMVKGVKVGSFTPNAWGIHDLMGNVVELTNDSMPYESEWVIGPCFRFLIKGDSYGKRYLTPRVDGSIYPEDWKDKGIKYRRYVIGCGQGYSLSVGHRLILVVKGEGQ